MMQKLINSYTAGTIDSDGCIGIYKMTDHYGICVSVSNVNYKLLSWLKYNWKGTISKEYQYGKSKPFKQWRVVGFAAIKILNYIRPYLIIKKNQAALGLKFMKIPQGKRIKFGKIYSDKCKLLNS